MTTIVKLNGNGLSSINVITAAYPLQVGQHGL